MLNFVRVMCAFSIVAMVIATLLDQMDLALIFGMNAALFFIYVYTREVMDNHE